jgi:tryptophanyl-tRNA synthetase
MKINERGYWENFDSEGHFFDSSLSDKLIEYSTENNVKTLCDFGCGMGDYVSKLLDNGFICEAYDGNPNTEKLTNGIAKTLDLSIPFELNKKFDCVLSFEVGEHIPSEYESVFINNLCNHSENLIIVSWAVEGQPGHGHVNCRNNDYIIKEFEKRDFIYDEINSTSLRNSHSNAWWFKNTIMVFKKNK